MIYKKELNWYDASKVVPSDERDVLVIYKAYSRTAVIMATFNNVELGSGWSESLDYHKIEDVIAWAELPFTEEKN